MKTKLFTLIGIATISLFTLAGCADKTVLPDTKTGKAETTINEQGNTPTDDQAVVEFEMESFNSTVDGAYAPRFSLKEIKVNKGDLVRMKINTTSGVHDFTIDEFNVFSETPEGQVTIIEFTPDEVGEYVYYCSKPRHRELGQWGTLIVTE